MVHMDRGASILFRGCCPLSVFVFMFITKFWQRVLPSAMSGTISLVSLAKVQRTHWRHVISIVSHPVPEYDPVRGRVSRESESGQVSIASQVTCKGPLSEVPGSIGVNNNNILKWNKNENQLQSALYIHVFICKYIDFEIFYNILQFGWKNCRMPKSFFFLKEGKLMLP